MLRTYSFIEKSKRSEGFSPCVFGSKFICRYTITHRPTLASFFGNPDLFFLGWRGEIGSLLGVSDLSRVRNLFEITRHERESVASHANNHIGASDTLSESRLAACRNLHIQNVFLALSISHVRPDSVWWVPDTRHCYPGGTSILAAILSPFPATLPPTSAEQAI